MAFHVYEQKDTRVYMVLCLGRIREDADVTTKYANNILTLLGLRGLDLKSHSVADVSEVSF